MYVSKDTEKAALLFTFRDCVLFLSCQLILSCSTLLFSFYSRVLFNGFQWFHSRDFTKYLDYVQHCAKVLTYDLRLVRSQTFLGMF